MLQSSIRARVEGSARAFLHAGSGTLLLPGGCLQTPLDVGQNIVNVLDANG